MWGAQAASLQLPAACRQHFDETSNVFKLKMSRQAAETNRPAACAPQNTAIMRCHYAAST